MKRFQYSPTELEVIENSHIPFAVYQFLDRHVVTIAVSLGFLELFGFKDRQEAIDCADEDMYRDAHPDDVARLSDAAIRFATVGGEYNVIYRSLIRGEYWIVRARGSHFYSPMGERLAVVWYSDEEKYDPGKDNIFDLALNNELDKSREIYRGQHDPLTGLPSMNYFFDLAEASRDLLVSEGQNPAMLFFDLNGMKNFNIVYGFSEGDKLILSMSKLLVRYFTAECCCRFGGDRFAVITVEENLESVLKEIFAECKKINDGKNLPVRVGIYLLSMGNVSAGIACDRAKLACDMNRDSTWSVYSYFKEGLLTDLERRQYIIDHLDRALEEGWVQAYYQPLIRAASGKVCDEEALARWIDPVKGFLSPADFIPILEEAKLIYRLDLYILEQVLKKMRRLEASGLYVVPCSINISRSDFETCDIVEEICRRVDEAGIKRRLITIEITESVIGQDVEYMKHQVERFHELGFKVWMDDYGSGYSSPDILTSIPFDTIKLDMMFIRQFEQNESSRIIISGLIKMAIGLGIETVVEGVETEAQVEFLKEIGCTRLQGYYFCKPIPLETILERYEKGAQIGFENPEEAEYYATIGRVNLYDLSISASDEEEFQDYFNTMPMAIMEIDDSALSVIRCNRSYREFIQNVFHVPQDNSKVKFSEWAGGLGEELVAELKKCAADGHQIITDQKTNDGRSIHLFIRRIAENPVSHVTALAIVVLAITDDNMLEAGVTYAHMAQALSADYINLYYVNMENEHFIEYRPDASQGEIAVERRGTDFFAKARRDAKKHLYPEDVELFVRLFTKNNVLRSIELYGAFTFTYRLLWDDELVYVNMKAIHIGSEGKHIIIGVNNVDAQMKQREELENIKEERTTYARISALSENFISFYTVDPETGSYFMYNASSDFETLGVSHSGEDFFADCVKEAHSVIYPEDEDLFFSEFTRDNVLKTVKNGGVFSLNYRLLIGGKPRHVRIKAAMITESGIDKVIVGVMDIDKQTHQDQERSRRKK